jgi:hypothetical protein
MITFVPHKLKQLNYDVSIEGIDSSFLTAYFRIIDKETNISYSIKGKIEGSKINFIIPPLNTFILSVKESYEAKLEVIGNKYYLQPWQDTITIFKEPIATATIVDTPETFEPDVNVVFMARDSVDVEELPLPNYNNGYEGIEEKVKSPEKPQDDEKPHKVKQYDAGKKKLLKKIFEE